MHQYTHSCFCYTVQWPSFSNTIMSKQSRKRALTIKIPSASEPHLYINSQQYISPIHLSVVSHYKGGVPVK